MKKYVLKKQGGLQLVTPSKLTIPYKQDLNEAQFKAVTAVNGVYLVIAGAGTGKTRTIVYRVAYLIELGVKPKDIVLLTFTRKSAQEMLRRAGALLDARCERVRGGTFHSFANLQLRKYASLLGYNNSFTILDQGDAQDAINLLRTRLKYDTKEKRFPRKDTLQDMYSRSLNTLVPVREIIAKDYPHFIQQTDDIMTLLSAYEKYKREYNVMDYDDLLVQFLTLLRTQQEVRATIAQECKYLMVDEYQDTNHLQAEIVAMLGSKHGNVMAVGDDAQTIYTFRGSALDNMHNFPRSFTGCEIITLEENYRSTQPILNLANEVLRRSADPTPQLNG